MNYRPFGDVAAMMNECGVTGPKLAKQPCPLCGEPRQLQVVVVDYKNDWRDIIKCRKCGCQGIRKYWENRVS